MFIQQSQGGYNRHGEQFSRGRFLLVFSHNMHKWEEQNNRPHVDLKGQWFDVTNGDGFVIKVQCTCDTPSYYLKYCKAHAHEYKTMPPALDRVLYACVRHVSLRQCGHFMMGSARIAGQSITVSGSYGSDGLPGDYETLTPAARAKLCQLPADLTDTFWRGGGHNSAGNEAPAMQKWALAVFPADSK